MTDAERVLERYLSNVFKSRYGEIRADFDTEDAVARIETTDQHLTAELTGAKFDIETDGETIVVTGYHGDATFAGVSIDAE